MNRYLIIALLSFGLMACGASSSQFVSEPSSGSSDMAVMAEMPPEPAYDAKAAPEMAIDAGMTSAGGSTAPLANGERLVVRDANLSIQVENVNDTDQRIRTLVSAENGFVLNSSTYGADQDVVINLTLKVPSNKLDSVITTIEQLAHKVVGRSMSGSDVTEEYVDLEGRLTALNASRDRLLELLKKAEKVEDAVAVNMALTDVQSQLEQVTGRMRYLRQSAAMSTITLDIRTIPVTQVVTDGWQPLEDARVALRDLLEFGQGLVSFLIALLIWTPVWLPLVVLVRYVRRRMQANKTPPAPPTTPAESA
ncbi:MAG: hypothetical protein RL076_1060 [Chloroflexota bacterium]|jgi:hypothetical protein